MDFKQLGQLGLVGWRKRVVDRITGPVTARTPIDPDQFRALMGALIFALSAYYLFSTLKRANKQLRGVPESEIVE